MFIYRRDSVHMRLIKRSAAALAAAALSLGLIVSGSATASADTGNDKHGHGHGHGLIGDVTIVAPVTLVFVDNAIAVLGVAEHDD